MDNITASNMLKMRNMGVNLPDDVYEMAIDAIKKRTPKKPKKIPDKYCNLVVRYYCPSCGRYFGQRGVHSSILFYKERYCQEEGCGQAIDWSNE